MSDVFVPLEIRDHDELLSYVTGLANAPATEKTSRWQKAKSVASTGVHKVKHGTTLVKGGIADVYKSTSARVVKLWDNHPTFATAMSTGVAFTLSFAVTLFLITGVLVMYILTLNWLDTLMG